MSFPWKYVFLTFLHRWQLCVGYVPFKVRYSVIHCAYLWPATTLYLHHVQHVSAEVSSLHQGVNYSRLTDDGWITRPKHVGGCVNKVQ
jgi:hypothetical protein